MAHSDTTVRETVERDDNAPPSSGVRVPQHIGVILDGNRRWAKGARVDASAGYARGGEQVCRLLRWCEQAGIHYVTLWALSVDNLRRSQEETAAVLCTIQDTFEKLAADGRWRIRLIGSPDLLDPAIAARLQRTVARTATLAGPTVNIAVAYDGRREILGAIRDMLSTEAGWRGAAAGLSEEMIAQHLETHGQPDPDLIIRTSGEQRLSGFMTWQCAYSELYFCDVPWPAFTKADFTRALDEFVARRRRFGL
jgi:short-chain Z-isoprenyl diphosphate synthase